MLLKAMVGQSTKFGAAGSDFAAAGLRTLALLLPR
jgi:hypothetical protein